MDIYDKIGTLSDLIPEISVQYFIDKEIFHPNSKIIIHAYKS